jgi:replicative DNA helicase
MTHASAVPDSERTLLSAALIAPTTVVAAVTALVAADDFYVPAHRVLWSAITSLDEKRQPIDRVTVVQELETQQTLPMLNSSGGENFVDELMADYFAATGFEWHARLIARKAERRRWQNIGVQIAAMGASDRDDDAFFSDAEQAALGLTQQRRGSSLQSSKQGLHALIKAVEERYSARQRGEKRIEIMTGFEAIDALTLGLRPGQVIVVAARPGMGKSALVANILEHAAGPDTAALMFPLEMSSAEMWTRWVVSHGVPAHRLRTGEMETAHWVAFTRAAGGLAAKPLWVDDVSDCGSATAYELRSRARRWRCGPARDYRRVIIAVDYLQLVEGSGARTDDTRAAEVGRVSRALKALAKELACPVIAVASLNRQCEQRQNKRPTMADLRESGQIEADADLIAFLYRDEVYNPESRDKGIAEVIVAKHRDSDAATLRLGWNPQQVSFYNLPSGGRRAP